MRVALLLLAAVGLRAQIAWFKDLSPSDDGQTLHFASPFVLRNSIPTVGTRVFRYTPSGIDLLATISSDPSVLVGVDSSGDSRTVAWWADRFSNDWVGAVTSAGVTQTFDRSVALSRNGRYAVLFSTFGPSTIPTLLDRVTGAQYAAPLDDRGAIPYVAARRQAITSTGQLLLIRILAGGNIQLFLWSPSATHNFPVLQTFRLARVSDDGSRVVWADSTTLHLIDVAADRDSIIGTFPGALISDFAISKSADRVALTANPSPDDPPQLYLVPSDGSGPQLIATRNGGFTGAAISGDGRFVFGATANGAVLRIDTATRQTGEIVAAPPIVSIITGASTTDRGPQPFPDLVPGSQYRITGTSLNDSISLGTTSLRLLSASAGEVRFQVPFDTKIGSSALHFASPSPFEQPLPLQVRPAAPIFFSLWDAGIGYPLIPLIIRGDFSGLATSVSPGDIVNFYMVGLGAVSPAVATGEPGPANPPAVVTSPPSATLGAAILADHGPRLTFGVPVLYAGLAPAFVGIYQLTVRIPDTPGLQLGRHDVTELHFRISGAEAEVFFTLTVN